MNKRMNPTTLGLLIALLSMTTVATAFSPKELGGTDFEDINTERNPGTDVVIGKEQFKALLAGAKQYVGKAEKTTSGRQAWMIGPGSTAYVELAVSASRVEFFARHTGSGDGPLKITTFAKDGSVLQEMALKQQPRFADIVLEGPIVAIELRNTARDELDGLAVIDDLSFKPAGN